VDNNKEEIARKNKEYYKKNKEYLYKKSYDYNKKMYNEDDFFRFKINVRSLVSNETHQIDLIKSNSIDLTRLFKDKCLIFESMKC